MNVDSTIKAIAIRKYFTHFFFLFQISNGDLMTTTQSPSEAAMASPAAEVTVVEQPQDNNNNNDGNNNEANDTNNNVGDLASVNNVTLSTSSTTDSLVTSTSTSTNTRPPALPPRPPNLVLPHAGAVPRQPQIPYTIMQQGTIIFFLDKFQTK